MYTTCICGGLRTVSTIMPPVVAREEATLLVIATADTTNMRRQQWANDNNAPMMMTHSARAVAHHQLICSHEPAAQTPSNTKGGTERSLRHLSYFVNTVESAAYITLWFRTHRPLVKYLMLLLFIQKSRSMTTQQPIEMLVEPSKNTEHGYSLYATVYIFYDDRHKGPQLSTGETDECPKYRPGTTTTVVSYFVQN